jgi:SpoVK/Ycf46/Vps4 family AAA+-type ATPase
LAGGEYDDDDDDDDDDGGKEATYAALVGVERAATAARASANGYLEYAEGYAAALRRFWWHRPQDHHRRRFDEGPARAHDRPSSPRSSPRAASHVGDRDDSEGDGDGRRLRRGGPGTPAASSELERAGRTLAAQLIDQVSLDVELSNALLSLLDDELYVDADGDGCDSMGTTTSTMEKLRVLGDAASLATRIDRSRWDFVTREVHDDNAAMDSRWEREREDEEGGGDAKEEDVVGASAGGAASDLLLNGESSTRILPLSSIYGSGGTIAADPRNAAMPVTTVCDWVESLSEQILSSSSVEEAVETFVRRRRRRRTGEGRRANRQSTNDDDDDDDASSSSARPLREEEGNGGYSAIMTSILLVGDEGCGKTHTMDAIQRRYSSSFDGSTATVEILRPDRAVDMVGNTIGSTEDRLIALFAHALERAGGGGDCLVVLDDVDRMFSLSDDDVDDDVGSSSDADSRYHLGRRCKALFVRILDVLQERQMSYHAGDDDGHVLLLCTARPRCGEVADRFDRVFRMGRPDDEHRRRMILSCLSPAKTDDGDFVIVGDASDDENGVIGTMASLVARHSVGKSACELAQCCREVLLRCAEQINSGRESDSDALKRRLRCLDGLLQTKTPQSLRGGSLEGVVDVRVFTPEELQSRLTLDENGGVVMPLLGAEAKRACDELMNVIVTPLCRSVEIRALLYGGGGSRSDDRDAARVGALLAGEPGVGKTSLAYHCAAVAAKMARVSLLDVSATSLIHKEIGGSERAVQSLFAAVRAAAPCVLLIDGIESVAPVRGNDTTTEGTMDRVLSTFLTEMDGIEDGGEGVSCCGGNVAVLGVTHRPDLIDPALLRPGRLEKTISLGAPEHGARREIVARQIEDIDFDFASAGYFDAKSKEDISGFVANETAGMSAMEVIAICREASMVCLRELNFEPMMKPSLTYNHFQRAITIIKGKA